MYYIPGYMYICSWITLNDLVNTHRDLSGLSQGGGGGGGGGVSLLSWRRDPPAVINHFWGPWIEMYGNLFCESVIEVHSVIPELPESSNVST